MRTESPIREPALPEGWTEQPFDEEDSAPPFYNDPEHDCNGTEGEDDPTDQNLAPIQGGAGNAQDRGWGGPCSGRIVTIVRSDGVRLPVRDEVKVLIALLCDETERRGYNLVPGWCWGYACRKIRGSSSWSNHAWGLAVDLNAPTNPMTSTLKTDMPGWMPELWNSYGFRWGGDYAGRKDAMHYEFLGTPTEALEMTQKAVMVLGRQEDWLMALTDAEQKELLENTRKILAGAFSKDPEKAKAATGRGDSLINVAVDARNLAHRAVQQTVPEGEA